MHEILRGFKADFSPGNDLLIFCLIAEKFREDHQQSNSPLPSHDGMIFSTLPIVPSLTIATFLPFHVGNIVVDLLFAAHTSLL